MKAHAKYEELLNFLELTANEVGQAFEMKYCLISLVLEGDQVFRLACPSNRTIQSDVIEEAKSFTRQVISSQQSLVIMDTRLESQYPIDHEMVDQQIIFYAGTALFDEQGQVIGTLSIFDDKPCPFGKKDLILLEMYGYRIKSEILLKKQRVYPFDHLGDQAVQDAVFITDREMKFISWNKSAEYMFGYHEDEIIGQSLYTILQPASSQQGSILDPAIGKLVELKGVKKDGNVFPIELCLLGGKIDDIVHYWGVIRDITEWNLIEKKLIESREKLSSIVENAGIGIAMLDMNGRTVECNKTLADFLGYGKDELLKIYVGDITHPDDLSKDYHLFMELIDQKRNNYQIEKRYFHKEGHIVWGRLTMSLIQDEDKQPLYAIGMVEDITERLELEKQLIVSEKFSAIGKLAAGLAHEIRNPLTSVMGFFKLMVQNKNNPEFNIEQYYDVLEDELQTMKRLVTDFVLMAKPSAPDRKLCNIHELLSETIQFMNSQAILKINKMIAYTDHSNNTYVLIDPTQIKQALINLIQNALEAVSTEGEVHVSTYLGQEEDILSIMIEDNGIGMKEEEMKQLLTPFFTTKENGIGLGLPICYRIIENHGGRLTYTSQEGEGTKFTVILPIATTHEQNI
jgi:PAS domain S-box-containing protein